jgi:hypothetical protein
MQSWLVRLHSAQWLSHALITGLRLSFSGHPCSGVTVCAASQLEFARREIRVR